MNIGSKMSIASEAIWSRNEKFSLSASLMHDIVSMYSFNHQVNHIYIYIYVYKVSIINYILVNCIGQNQGMSTTLGVLIKYLIS